MIRELTVKDLDLFIQIRRDSLVSEPFSFGSSPFAEIDRDRTRKNLAKDSSESFTLGYFIDGQVVGMVGFFRDQGIKFRHRGNVWGMYVYPEYRGQGIGLKLIEELIQRAIQISGLSKIMLSVTDVSQSAVNMYQRAGFEIYGEEKEGLMWGDHTFGMIYMQRKL